MNRTIRRSFDTTLTGIGMVFIFGAVLLGGSQSLQLLMPMAVIGVLLMEAGVWGMATKVLPTDRRYHGLRSEGDYMLSLIRDLNAAAVARAHGEDDGTRFLDTLEEMHSSVVRMSELAGMDEATTE